MPICPICGKNFTYLQEHHIVPRCYGLMPGEIFQVAIKDNIWELNRDSTINICENDHIHTIHETANRLIKGLNPKETISDINLKVAAPYIKVILEAHNRLRGRNATLRNLGRPNLTEYEWIKLNTIAKDAGCKHVTEYIEKLIKRIVE